jgi:GNAT superfamily N-acetyltransferase
VSEALTLRLMSEEELVRLVGWAAEEDWNPGLHDARVFWETDPEAFIGAELEGELIGGGAITSYGGAFGFMGLFIVRREYRGHGYGARLWHARVKLLQARLDPGAPIGMDGVFAMQDWYAKGGFRFSHRTIRFEWVGREAEPAPGLVPAHEVPFERVLAYDRRCFPAPRERFLRAWMEQPDSRALVAVEKDAVRGFAVARRCALGVKVGPLFADDAATAESLYDAVAAFAPDEPVFLDVPEVNAWAMSLAKRRRMHEVFGCARMYLGAPPRIDESRVYGVTTFELG